MRAWLILVVLGLGMAACRAPQEPTGVGDSTDDFKPSPCACDEPFYVDGEWVG